MKFTLHGILLPSAGILLFDFNVSSDRRNFAETIAALKSPVATEFDDHQPRLGKLGAWPSYSREQLAQRSLNA